ncbi:MAG: class I SAM-dependent methyltransferase [Verrucomicrobiia bacterium]
MANKELNMYRRINCPCCGSGKTDVVANLEYSDSFVKDSSRELSEFLMNSRYIVRYCIGCAFYFKEFALEDDEAMTVYSLYEESSGCSLKSLREYAHIAEDAMLIRLLFPEKTPVVLDFAMNRGDWAAMAKAYGCDVYGSDIASFSKLKATEKGIKFIEFENLSENKFDFINADQVFEHLSEPFVVLKRLVSALKNGGIIKISTLGDKAFSKKLKYLNNKTIFSEKFVKLFDPLFPLIHINLFSATSLKKLGIRAGLRPIRIPLRISYSTMTLFDSLRQINRNLYNPFKRWLSSGTWQYFKKVK